MIQDPANVGNPFGAVTVTFVGDGVPAIGGAVPLISRGVSPVRQPVTLISGPTARPALFLIHSRLAPLGRM